MNICEQNLDLFTLEETPSIDNRIKKKQSIEIDKN